MRVGVIEKPLPLVSLEDARPHLRVDDDDDDDVIEALIGAACQHIDGPKTWLGRAVGVQVLELALEDWGCRGWGGCLPGGEILEIVSVTYRDPSGADQTVPSESYSLAGNCIWQALNWVHPALDRTRPDSVRIRYRAGYGKQVAGTWQNDTPQPIRVAVLMHVAALWRGRGDGGDAIGLPKAAEALLQPYRIWSV